MLKRWIFCILLICLLFSIAGCGAQKEAAGNNIDGNYYLTEEGEEKYPDWHGTKIGIVHSSSTNDYTIMRYDPDYKINGVSTEKMGLGHYVDFDMGQHGTWVDAQRCVDFSSEMKGTVSYSWFEYHIAAQWPLSYVMDLEAEYQFKGKNVPLVRYSPVHAFVRRFTAD